VTCSCNLFQQKIQNEWFTKLFLDTYVYCGSDAYKLMVECMVTGYNPCAPYGSQQEENGMGKKQDKDKKKKKECKKKSCKSKDVKKKACKKKGKKKDKKDKKKKRKRNNPR